MYLIEFYTKRVVGAVVIFSITIKYICSSKRMTGAGDFKAVEILPIFWHLMAWVVILVFHILRKMQEINFINEANT